MKAILLCTIILLTGINCADKNSAYPILILVDDTNFGTYTGEILKAEGFNAYKSDTLSPKITLDYLQKFNLIILGEKRLTKSQSDLFFNFVKGGGNLITFRPEEQLAPLFGLKNSGKSISEGYIKIDTTTNIGKGLVPQTIQYHGTSTLYTLNGGKKLAELYSDAINLTGYPSLAINQFGDGYAAAFTYNLPQSIVYTRQGNPDWAGEERDKVDGPTATDLFYPKAGETQWNDPSKIAIPQADEQMRLLSHVIEYMNLSKNPLPRFWYFPDQYKSIFIFTIDGEDSKEEDIGNEIADVQSKGGNATLYEIGTYIRPETVAKWRSMGNEVAVHYNDVPNYANPTHENMNTVLDTMTANFRKAYGYLPKTTRNHWVVWVSKDSTGKREFAEQAVLEEKYGIGFDCNYYQFGGNKVYPNWMGDVGHFNGSGIPMKFAKSNGRILNIYQSNTQLPDETWLKENIESKSKTMIDRSLDEENYAWLNANYHTWYWPECREPGLRVLDYCKSRGVPVWTAEKAYEFLEMKDEASFSNINWTGNRLSFTLNSSLKHSNGLTFFVPASFNGMNIQSIKEDNADHNIVIKRLKGSDYAFVTIQPGQTHNFLISYK